MADRHCQQNNQPDITSRPHGASQHQYLTKSYEDDEDPISATDQLFCAISAKPKKNWNGGEQTQPRSYRAEEGFDTRFAFFEVGTVRVTAGSLCTTTAPGCRKRRGQDQCAWFTQLFPSPLCVCVPPTCRLWATKLSTNNLWSGSIVEDAPWKGNLCRKQFDLCFLVAGLLFRSC